MRTKKWIMTLLFLTPAYPAWPQVIAGQELVITRYYRNAQGDTVRLETVFLSRPANVRDLLLHRFMIEALALFDEQLKQRKFTETPPVLPDHGSFSPVGNSASGGRHQASFCSVEYQFWWEEIDQKVSLASRGLIGCSGSTRPGTIFLRVANPISSLTGELDLQLRAREAPARR